MKVSNLISVASMSALLLTPAFAGITKPRPSAQTALSPTSDGLPPLSRQATDGLPSPYDWRHAADTLPAGDRAADTAPSLSGSNSNFVDRPQSQELIAQEGHAVVYVVDPIAHRPVRNAFVRITPLDTGGSNLQAQWTGFTDDRGSFDPGVLPAASYMAEVMTFIDRGHRRFILDSGEYEIVMVEVESELD
jgi:hypothetical protein